MRAYENGTSAYFATPSVNLIYAFHTSLTQITKGVPSLEDRFQLHREASRRIKAAVENLGLRQLPVKPEQAANGMTAVSLLTLFFSNTGRQIYRSFCVPIETELSNFSIRFGSLMG